LIVYDDAGGVIAARFWWMGTELGLDVAVLDGGVQGWPGQLTTEVDLVPEVDPQLEFDAEGFASGTVTLEELLYALGDSTVRLTDARDSARYRGEVEPVDPRAGHIPGALSLPSSSLLQYPGGPHRSREELSEIIADVLGSELNERTLVASCGSGVTACHTILVMEHVYGLRPRLFPGSFSQWSRRLELAVAIGADVGTLDEDEEGRVS
jgi:thiosulfate/3-mercaptopyruvate sulfurtransferase